MGTITQQRWVNKLLGYNFIIAYKRGNENKAHENLKNIADQEAILAMVFFPMLDWIEEFRGSYQKLEEFKELILELSNIEERQKMYQV